MSWSFSLIINDWTNIQVFLMYPFILFLVSKWWFSNENYYKHFILSYALCISSIVLMTGLVILLVNVISLWVLNRTPRNDILSCLMFGLNLWLSFRIHHVQFFVFNPHPLYLSSISFSCWIDSIIPVLQIDLISFRLETSVNWF